jgi:hypothetical protein
MGGTPVSYFAKKQISIETAPLLGHGNILQTLWFKRRMQFIEALVLQLQSQGINALLAGLNLHVQRGNWIKRG